MTTDRDARVERLRAAARQKHQAARERAEHGLEQLLQRHEPVTFRAVARAGQVSIDFLYREPEIRTRIQGLRATAIPVEAEVPPTRSTVVHALTARNSAGCVPRTPTYGTGLRPPTERSSGSSERWVVAPGGGMGKNQ